LLGKTVGSTNFVLVDRTGQCTVMDVIVGMDTAPLRASLTQLLPGERNVVVTSAADSLVLTGSVADAAKLDRVLDLANAYARRAGGGGGQAGASPRVVNLLVVDAPQQVLLEVKVAEVSKALVDKLGASLKLQRTNGGWTYSLLANFLSGGVGLVDAFRRATGEFITIDGEKTDNLVKILAEPNLMAISGQEGSFLAGGKVFLPVPQFSGGAVAITLQEQDFGVGLNVTTDIKAFPVLGEIPILGALFRSTGFQTDKTELIFVITPRLARPMPADYRLPTDSYIEPTRLELFLGGKMEGEPPPPTAQPA